MNQHIVSLEFLHVYFLGHQRFWMVAALCPCRDLLDLLANKWSALAISALEGGPQRFGELRVRLEGISPKVLSSTLKRLEARGLLDRSVYAEVPARVEYQLTSLGHSASEPLSALRSWVEDNIPASV